MANIGRVNPIRHICDGENIAVNDRREITKIYKRWLLHHHPDKVNDCDMVDIFIIKEYGATLLQHDENDDKWDIIENCYQVLSTFEKLSELNIDEIRDLRKY